LNSGYPLLIDVVDVVVDDVVDIVVELIINNPMRE
jgi:hypothetical protein